MGPNLTLSKLIAHHLEGLEKCFEVMKWDVPWPSDIQDAYLDLRLYVKNIRDLIERYDFLVQNKQDPSGQ